VRLKPVSVCVAVTVTPGSTAPLWSVTRPPICAIACANTVALNSTMSAALENVRITGVMEPPLSSGRA
jgi:hypothetical protein